MSPDWRSFFLASSSAVWSLVAASVSLSMSAARRFESSSETASMTFLRASCASFRTRRARALAASCARDARMSQARAPSLSRERDRFDQRGPRRSRSPCCDERRPTLRGHAVANAAALAAVCLASADGRARGTRIYVACVSPSVVVVVVVPPPFFREEKKKRRKRNERRGRFRDATRPFPEFGTRPRRFGAVDLGVERETFELAQCIRDGLGVVVSARRRACREGSDDRDSATGLAHARRRGRAHTPPQTEESALLFSNREKSCAGRVLWAGASCAS